MMESTMNIKSIRLLSLIFIILLIRLTLLPAHSFDRSLVMVSETKGVLISYNSTSNWEEFNSGLPAKLVPQKITVDSNRNIYITTMESGIFRLKKGGDRWTNISSADFRRRTQLKGDLKFRKITAFDINRTNPREMLLATKHWIYSSSNSGKTWKRFKSRGLSSRNYITALGINGSKSTTIIGTSYKGIFKKVSGRYRRSSTGMPSEAYSAGLSFYDEPGAIAFDRTRPGTLYAGLNFSGGMYISQNSGKSWKSMQIPLNRKNRFMIYDIESSANSVSASTGKGIYLYNKKTGKWSRSPLNGLLKQAIGDYDPLAICIFNSKFSLYVPISSNREIKTSIRKKTAADKKALYAGIYSLKRGINGILKTIQRGGFNAIVIDVKDDSGNVFFNARNKTAHKIGAVRKNYRLESTVKRFRQAGVYTIARIVVFKDPKLYRAFGNKYAIWNGRHNTPWVGAPGERWVDPHSDFVRRYNVALARETARLGFDEIQFDYIRFPADGPIYQCRYRHQKSPGMFKSEALADFLKTARKEISVPISVDVYGFNAWYHYGNIIGQDIEEFARHTDIICPMVYPSHFGNRFYKSGPREQRPYRIVYESGRRSRLLTNDTVIIRPYLQAFRLLSPTWGPGYINAQIRASRDSGCSGFIFWNANGDYKMVMRALPHK